MTGVVEAYTPQTIAGVRVRAPLTLSALGQKQTFALQKAITALPPKTDMCSATQHVRFVPEADIGANCVLLFDDFVGAQRETRGDGIVDCLGSLQVNDELERTRLLDR